MLSTIKQQCNWVTWCWMTCKRDDQSATVYLQSSYNRQEWSNTRIMMTKIMHQHKRTWSAILIPALAKEISRASSRDRGRNLSDKAVLQHSTQHQQQFHNTVNTSCAEKRPQYNIYSVKNIASRHRFLLHESSFSMKSSDISFNCFRQQLKHFYFVNIDTSPSTTLAH